ncbi:urease accessory protein UreF [Salinicola peritrichatus]|uniref:urease accessory protein UreF n=1 Tax=Salinicola peritrichatus TaxID=1267424 RepID=UPI000DA1E04E|nr:urease accessory UreF family protein [Salinicola peritrichatus]
MTEYSFADRAGPLLALMQLSDSALPIGRHAHAFGLERLFRDGRVDTPCALHSMIVSALIQGTARADGAATALAHDALTANDLQKLATVDARLDLLKLTGPAQAASRRCGSRLAALAPSVHSNPILAGYVAEVASKVTPGHLAVVSGTIASAAGISREDAVLLELRGVATMILSAAVRLDVIPATAAQAMLVEISPEVIKAADIALSTKLDEMECSAAAGLEIAAMRHARDHGRLFAT